MFTWQNGCRSVHSFHDGSQGLKDRERKKRRKSISATWSALQLQAFIRPFVQDDVLKLWGRNRGIQGHQNSCYLDATLFTMFSFTSIFDCLLYRPQNVEDIPEYGEVQKVLREEIVNPLRKNLFVRADKVMKLRQFLDSLTSVKGLMSEEKGKKGHKNF